MNEYNDYKSYLLNKIIVFIGNSIFIFFWTIFWVIALILFAYLFGGLLDFLTAADKFIMCAIS